MVGVGVYWNVELVQVGYFPFYSPAIPYLDVDAKIGRASLDVRGSIATFDSSTATDTALRFLLNK